MTKAVIVRRQSIRAMHTLIRRWPTVYWQDSFEILQSEEFGNLAGTVMYWTTPYDGDADCRTAIEELTNLRQDEKIDWARMYREDCIRERYPKNIYTNYACLC